MASWQSYFFGDIVDLYQGLAINSKTKYLVSETKTKTPLLRIKDLLENSEEIYIDSKNAPQKSLVNRNDLVFTRTGQVGYVFMGRYGVLHNNCFRIVPRNNDLVLNEFLFYHFKVPGMREFLTSISAGSVQPDMNHKIFKTLKIQLPPLQEQRAIAEVLSSLDDKIELLQKQNETLEALAQSLFRQWYIEEADDTWEEVELIDVFDFKEGPGIRNWQYVEEGFPFINIRLIKNKEIDKSTANCVSNEEANGKYNHFKLEVDDFVMSTSGTLGKNAIVRDYHLPLLLNTSVIRFRPKESYLKCFMYQYLQSREFTEYLLSAASGSVQLNFGPMHLKAVSLRLPSSERLESFELNCNPFYEKINHNYKSIQTLSQTRDTLLPKLMSGEVRVKLD